MACIYDLDCPNNMACMINASWFDPTVHDACMCNTYYGFTNPVLNCTGVLESPTSQFWVASSALLLILSLVLVLYSAWGVFQLLRYKLLAKDAQTIGSLQILLCSLWVTGNQVGTMASALLPNSAYHSSQPPLGDKGNEQHTMWISSMCIAAVLALSGAITIAMMWIEVANRVARMQFATTSNHQRWVFSLELIILVSLLIPLCIGQPTYALLIAFILQLVTLILYVYGNLKITRVVRKTDATSLHEIASSESHKEYKRVLRRMFTSTLIIGTVVLLGCAFSILLLMTTIMGWREYAQPEKVSLSIVANQMMVFSVIVAGLEVAKFLCESTLRKIARKQKISNESRNNSKELVPVSMASPSHPQSRF
ncbi:hypothetical protein BASA81_007075 [Batrachochytrium salamandrivorans]|nr:hypothetical protein BASA81_007075 [Batrachochytrium salamandrivorans]